MNCFSSGLRLLRLGFVRQNQGERQSSYWSKQNETATASRSLQVFRGLDQLIRTGDFKWFALLDPDIAELDGHGRPSMNLQGQNAQMGFARRLTG